MTALLFPLDVRLTTWLGMAAFVWLGYRDRRAVYACCAWLLGFEAVYVACQAAYGRDHRPVQFLYVALGVAVQPWLARRGVRPNLLLLAAAFAVWAVWVATGYHVNGHSLVGLDPLAEALNEGSKTLWAFAYLIPLLHLVPGRALARARAAL